MSNRANDIIHSILSERSDCHWWPYKQVVVTTLCDKLACVVELCVITWCKSSKTADVAV